MSTAAQRRMPKSKRTKAIERAAQERRSKTLFAAGAIVLVAVFALAVVLTRGEGTKSPTVAQTRSVSVSGVALPDLGVKEAVGTQIPEATGESFDGERVAIERDGTPKMLVFLAHWCPHCQAEVPILQSWIDAGQAPQDIDIVSVATATDPTQPNYPPSRWLQDEGWTPPVLVDSARAEVADAFGVDGYPFFVFVDEAGQVAHRASGELAIEHIEEILGQL